MCSLTLCDYLNRDKKKLKKMPFCEHRHIYFGGGVDCSRELLHCGRVVWKAAYLWSSNSNLRPSKRNRDVGRCSVGWKNTLSLWDSDLQLDIAFIWIPFRRRRGGSDLRWGPRSCFGHCFHSQMDPRCCEGSTCLRRCSHGGERSPRKWSNVIITCNNKTHVHIKLNAKL